MLCLNNTVLFYMEYHTCIAFSCSSPCPEKSYKEPKGHFSAEGCSLVTDMSLSVPQQQVRPGQAVAFGSSWCFRGARSVLV